MSRRKKRSTQNITARQTLPATTNSEHTPSSNTKQGQHAGIRRTLETIISGGAIVVLLDWAISLSGLVNQIAATAIGSIAIVAAIWLWCSHIPNEWQLKSWSVRRLRYVVASILTVAVVILGAFVTWSMRQLPLEQRLESWIKSYNNVSFRKEDTENNEFTFRCLFQNGFSPDVYVPFTVLKKKNQSVQSLIVASGVMLDKRQLAIWTQMTESERNDLVSAIERQMRMQGTNIQKKMPEFAAATVDVSINDKLDRDILKDRINEAISGFATIQDALISYFAAYEERIKTRSQ